MVYGFGLDMARNKADEDAKFVSIPGILARLLNRIAAMRRGVWMVVIIKGDSGARGIIGWSVVEMPLEPKDALADVGGGNP